MRFSCFRQISRLVSARAFLVIFVTMLLLFSLGEASGASGDGHGKENEQKRWIATDTYRVMNFVVLAAALFFLLRKPTSQALTGRIKGIKNQLSELESKKEAAEKQLAEYNNRLSLLDQAAEKIVDGYIRQGNEAKVKILREVEATVEKLNEQAQKTIEYEFKQATMKLQKEILEKALAKAEGIIREKISSEDQNRLIDEYVEKVVVQ
ncbi:MAG TPA: ATP synthase F0 subunit B [Desulfobacterales bacterium]|nr:ATP synthase F0 subunit B [Desulfobacterales bacterium]